MKKNIGFILNMVLLILSLIAFVYSVFYVRQGHADRVLPLVFLLIMLSALATLFTQIKQKKA